MVVAAAAYGSRCCVAGLVKGPLAAPSSNNPLPPPPKSSTAKNGWGPSSMACFFPDLGGSSPSRIVLHASFVGVPSDALLLVSGSHPVRQLPMASQLLPGSVKMLQRGQQLKAAGVLPQQLELWAVANPVTERDASYTEQKVGGSRREGGRWGCLCNAVNNKAYVSLSVSTTGQE